MDLNNDRDQTRERSDPRVLIWFMIISSVTLITLCAISGYAVTHWGK